MMWGHESARGERPLGKEREPPMGKEVGLEKLLIHADKLHAVDASGASVVDTSYPISVELSLTMRCNFNCVWCSDKALRARTDDDMSLELLENLFRDLSVNGTHGVVIEGGGEPTIFRDFEAVVDLLVRYGLGAGLITHGGTPLNSRTLKLFDWIRVSLDASTREEHLKLKGVDAFDRVLANIADYASHCPVVGVGYVVTNQNSQGIDSLIPRLKELGASYVQLRPVVDHEDLLADTDLTDLKRYESAGFAVIIDGMRENLITGNNGLPCKAHSLTSVINANGAVYLCGRLNIHPWIEPVGNLHLQSFHEIWNGEERRRQHEMVADERFCRKFCPQCRLTKFNEMFDGMASLKTRRFI